jgi:hypothetical protein
MDGVDLFLNCAWGLIALVGMDHWLRTWRKNSASHRASLAALITILVILFPVISLNDDLYFAQNLSDIDSVGCSSRPISSAHSFFPAIPDLPELAIRAMSLGALRPRVLESVSVPSVGNPARNPVWSRPPPFA